MKTLYALLIISLFTSFGANAQSKVSYDNSKWFLGLNAGGTYHSNTEVDVHAIYRAGLGFTLGKSFNMEQGKFFSWDFRFRYLHANYRGLSRTKYDLDSTSTQNLNLGTVLDEYQQAYGYYVPNFNTKVNDFSLELQLNTNRLRERTGWNLFVFGGLGLTHYKTAVDLTESGFIKDENDLFDKADFTTGYETKVTERVEVMPHFGAGIEKQLSPRVSFGIMGRMSWTRHNDFDGLPNNMDGTVSTLNDRYHYVSAGFKFYLGRGNANGHTTPNQNGTAPNTPPTPSGNVGGGTVKPTPQKPVVDFTNPSHSPITVSSPNFHIDANVFYVMGKNNILFKHNGVGNQNFTYNANTDELDANVILSPGQNIFEITGTNEAGSDQESTIIILNIPDVEEVNPPIVTITSPSQSNIEVTNPIYAFSSTILNVTGKSNTSMVVNNVNYSNYTYSTNTKVLNTTLNLIEGVNIITVKGVNQDGQDSKTTKIIYIKPKEVQPPVVTITSPNYSPYTVGVNSINVVGTVLNVDAKANVEVRFNGNSVSNFSYNTNTKQVLVPLNSIVVGGNVLSIKGTNIVGQDIASTTIIYKIPESPKPPIVSFINPSSSPTVVYVNNYAVVSKVLNVSSASDITVKVNGSQLTNFNYVSSSDLVSFTAVLNQGANVVEVKGVNQDGEDSETTTIVYKRQVVLEPKPVVTITSPAVDNIVFGVQGITVNATVLNVDNSSNIEVKFNGVTTTNFTFNQATKVLNLPVVLVDGSNSVYVKGTNNSGEDSKTRLIIYKLPVKPTPPSVVFTNPPVTPFNVTSPFFTMTATTTEIDVKNQIVLKVNGVVVPGSQYAFSNNTVQYNTTLNNGSNVFEISVSNNFGSDSKLAIVNLQDTAPCTAPTVGYVAPQPNSTVTDGDVTIEAQINNYIAGTLVELFHNGVSVGNMTYNDATSVATKQLVMLAGSNSFVVQVSNACGDNQSAFVLTLKQANVPCNKPIITTSQVISSPTDDTVYDFLFEVQHIVGINDLVATVNGVVVPVGLNGNTSTFKIDDAPLNVGVNTVVINAVNNCGTDQYTYTITRNNCDSPIVTVTSALTSVNGAYVLTSSVLNATSVVVSLNGNVIPHTFNPTTGALIVKCNLIDGSNMFTIVADGCDDVTETINVVHTEPCDSPIVNITSGLTSTNSTYVLTGTIVNATSVEVMLNGVVIPATFNSTTGVLNASCSLIDGSNKIRITAEGCASETKTILVSYVAPCNAPVISFVNVTSYENDGYPLKVIITNVSSASELTLKVNGQVEAFEFNNGVLTAILPLGESGADVEVMAITCEEVINTLHVDYIIPCIPPIVKIDKISVVNGTNNEYLLIAQVTNMNDPNGVTVKVNGEVVTSNFNNVKQFVSAQFPVVNGENTVEVIVVGCETVIVTEIFTVVPPCSTPEINIVTLTTYENDAYPLKAVITNVSSASELMLKVNGQTTAFQFNNGVLTATLSLGENGADIEITANTCEEVISPLHVDYIIPCISPIVKIDKIGLVDANGLNTNGVIEYVLIAQVTNMNDPNGVTVKVNGSVVTSNFNNVKQFVSAQFPVVNGENTVEVIVTGCDTVTVTEVFTVVPPCESPVINVTSSLSSTTSAYILTGTITNATSVMVKLNGVEVPATFNSGTGVLVVNSTLVVGDNNFVITANGCSVETKNISVSYTALVPCNAPVITVSTLSLSTQNTLSSSYNYSLSAVVTNISNASDISITVNGSAVTSSYNVTTGVLTSSFPIIEGENTVVITANGCETVSATETFTYTTQCDAPTINLTSASVASTANYVLAGTVSNIDNATNVSVSLNGTLVNSTYNTVTGVLASTFSLVEGTNTINVTANGCESVSEVLNVVYTAPCNTPVITLTSASDVTVANYVLVGSVTNIDNSSDVSVKLNGTLVNSIYNTTTDLLSSMMSLVQGTNVITVSANGCEDVSESLTVNLALASCGPRFNPGNSDWEFCLVTPTGTFSRDDLSGNSNFTYSGPASSIYFKPIAGGGNAEVNGNAYGVQNGNYYLFTGNLTIDVSNSNPGSMGHWEVCLSSDTYPVFGNGNNKPVSPCQSADNKIQLKPTIKTILPTVTRKTVTSNMFYFKAKVTSIESKDQIKLTVNGRTQNTYIYSKGSNNVSGSFKLIKGMNYIIVTVTNPAGTNILRYNINYAPKTVSTKPTSTSTKPKPTTTTKPKPTETTKPTSTRPNSTTTKPEASTTKPSQKGTSPKPKTEETKPKTSNSKGKGTSTGRK